MSEEQLIKTPCVFGENGNFLLERELGRGGMGGVYMGRDKMLDRPVAVKVMLREYGSDPEFVEKFKREAQAAARLIHPNIAQVYSYGFADGMPYIAMELVAGGSLDQIMANTGANSDIPRIMKICEQVAQALRCAADQGLVHGDVKPENVLLDANGNAKLVDFGLAAMQRNTDEIWGTPYYIAPEKVRKENVDYRADMYSLGGTIYHAITGVAPFEGEDAAAVVRKRFEGAPKKPSEVRPGISPQIDYLVMKMLAMDPANRYPSFEALLDDFKKVMTKGLSSTAPLAEPAGVHTGKTGRFTTTSKRLTISKKTTRSIPAETDDGGAPSQRRLARLRKPKIGGVSVNLAEAAADGGQDYEDEEGGVGGKVALVVGGVVAAIALVVGGLVWYKVSTDNAKEKAHQEMVAGKIRESRDSLGKTREKALKFADEIEKFSEEAVKDCEGYTDKLKEALSVQYAASVIVSLKPGPTAELLKARADLAAAEAGAAAAASATGAVQHAQGTIAVSAQAAPAAAPKRFRPPQGDECDPNSPEGQAYAEEKAKWEAEHAPGRKKAPAAEVQAAAPEAPQTDAEGRLTSAPAAVSDVRGLWEQAYECQTAAIRIRIMVRSLVSDVDAALAANGAGDEFLKTISDAANDAARRYSEISGAPEYMTISKAKGIITGRGKRVLDKTIKEIRARAKEQAREREKKDAAEKEKERQERLAREKAEKIAAEIDAARAAFDAVVAGGKIRQLDWKGAYRILEGVEVTTAEGELALRDQTNKVHSMEFMHDVLWKNLKGYTFTRFSKNPKENLKGAVVKDADRDRITVVKKGAEGSVAIPWPTFYKNYANNLDEIITKFILKSGSVEGKKRLTKKEYADAIVGVAFMMRIVCSEKTPSALDYGNKLIMDAVKADPGLHRRAKESFPDLEFGDALKAADAETL